MTWKKELYAQNGSYAAVDDRFLIDTLFSEGVMNVAAGQGVAVQRPAGANLSVLVSALDCIIDGDDVVRQGSYLGRMIEAEYVDVTAPSTTNPRIDLLIAEVIDAQYRTPTATLKEGIHLRIVAGTPAASPVVPALPPTAIPLAQIAVPANALSIVNANITDVRQQSGAAPGVQFFQDVLRTFTANGSFVVPAGVSILDMVLVGGGGGGGGGGTSGSSGFFNGGGGGGAGQVARFVIPVNSGETVTWTVGAGGSGGAGQPYNGNANPTNGTSGGSTVFTCAAGTFTALGGGLGGNFGGAYGTTSPGTSTPFPAGTGAACTNTNVGGKQPDAGAVVDGFVSGGGAGAGANPNTYVGTPGLAGTSTTPGVSGTNAAGTGANSTAGGTTRDGQDATVPGCGGGGGAAIYAQSINAGKGGRGAPGFLRMRYLGPKN